MSEELILRLGLEPEVLWSLSPELKRGWVSPFLQQSSRMLSL